MSDVGILAYGSLIDEPGHEIGAVVSSNRDDVWTPFRVEFARSSSKRGGAPTLVPVEKGGAQVKAVILVLKETVSLDEAKDMLWRRETNNIGTGQCYRRPASPGQNKVFVEQLNDFNGIRSIIYTCIIADIPRLTSAKLAELAIQSASGAHGAEKRDGISYLISTKRIGIVTLLSSAYEKEILEKTQSQTLEEAWQNCRNKAPT